MVITGLCWRREHRSVVCVAATSSSPKVQLLKSTRTVNSCTSCCLHLLRIHIICMNQLIFSNAYGVTIWTSPMCLWFLSLGLGFLAHYPSIVPCKIFTYFCCNWNYSLQGLVYCDCGLLSSSFRLQVFEVLENIAERYLTTRSQYMVKHRRKRDYKRPFWRGAYSR